MGLILLKNKILYDPWLRKSRSWERIQQIEWWFQQGLKSTKKEFNSYKQTYKKKKV